MGGGDGRLACDYGIGKKPEGLDNPEDFPRLLQRLRDRGYREGDVESIAGGGFLGYYRRIST